MSEEKTEIVSRGEFSLDGKPLPGCDDRGFYSARLKAGFGHVNVAAGKYPVSIEVRDGQTVLVWEHGKQERVYGPAAVFVPPGSTKRVKL